MNQHRFLAPLAATALLLGCLACAPATAPPPGEDAANRAGEDAAPVDKVYTIHMPAPAAASYRTGEPGATVLAHSIERSFPGVTVDACLERAAAGYADGLEIFPDDPPLDFSEFTLHWAGCPDPTVAVTTLATDDSSADAVVDLLGEVLADGVYTHVGAARASGRHHRWLWVVMLVNRSFELRQVPASAEPGARLPLMFRLPDGFREATLYVTQPRGQIEKHGVGLGGGWAVASVPLAGEVGRHWVELLASDANGPTVVALFPVEAGREPPRTWVGKAHPDESWITDTSTAERHVLELLNRDRSVFGLRPLEPDPRLEAIARAHSEDMAKSGFFAHVSPSSGDISDRLRTSGYRTRVAMENLASSRTLAEAQEGLMRSPGHRAAILSPEVNRVGVGVVRRLHDEEDGWLVTQIFARPVNPTPPDELAAQVTEAVRDRRRRAMLATATSVALERIAHDIAVAAIDEPDVLNRRGGTIGREISLADPSYRSWKAVWGTAFELEDVELPEIVDAADARAFGIAAAHEPARPADPTTFVILLAY